MKTNIQGSAFLAPIKLSITPAGLQEIPPNPIQAKPSQRSIASCSGWGQSANTIARLLSCPKCKNPRLGRKKRTSGITSWMRRLSHSKSLMPGKMAYQPFMKSYGEDWESSSPYISLDCWSMISLKWEEVTFLIEHQQCFLGSKSKFKA